mgnify:CR=1 FL=1
MGRLYGAVPFALRVVLYLPVRFLLPVFCDFKVRGIENVCIAKTRGIVFAANHASEIDPPVVSAALPLFGIHNPLFFAADEPKLFGSKETFGWRSYIYKGWFFKAFGAWSVYLSKNRFRERLKHQVDMLHDNRSILFFPEGGRTRDGALKPAKPGIGYLLYKVQPIIIPVAISGTYGMSVKNFLAGKMKITVSFGSPLEIHDIWSGEQEKRRVSDFKEGADRIMLRVKELLDSETA